eukprot:CRZ07210.1 hypothetical protein [Spongospora subterranea]
MIEYSKGGQHFFLIIVKIVAQHRMQISIADNAQRLIVSFSQKTEAPKHYVRQSCQDNVFDDAESMAIIKYFTGQTSEEFQYSIPLPRKVMPSHSVRNIKSAKADYTSMVAITLVEQSYDDTASLDSL